MKEVNIKINPKDAAEFIQKALTLDEKSNISPFIKPLYPDKFDTYINCGDLVVVINDPKESHDMGVKQKNFHLLTLYRWDETHHNYERVTSIESVLPTLGKTYERCYRLIEYEQEMLGIGDEEQTESSTTTGKEQSESSSFSKGKEEDLVQKKDRLIGQKTVKGRKVSTPDITPTGNLQQEKKEQQDPQLHSQQGGQSSYSEGDISKRQDRLKDMQMDLIKAVISTPTMKEARKLVGSDLSDNDWCDLIYHHWFHRYNIQDVKQEVSGFDFNFIGELSSGRIANYHWWFKCLVDDLHAHRNLGYVEQQDQRGNPHYIAFKTRQAKGGLSSFFVGMPPETYMAIGMVLHYTQKGSVNFDCYHDTFEFVHNEAGNKQEYIRTVFPQLPSTVSG